MSESDETDVVRRFTFEGKKYLKSKKTGVIYNLEEEVIGKWNEAKNRIDFDEDDEDDDDEEDDDDDYPDETDGLYYLSKSPEYFSQTKEILKEDGITISHHIATFDTGIRIQRSSMSDNIVKLDAFLAFGVPVIVETNGLVRIFGNRSNNSNSFIVDFVTKDGSIRKRGIDSKSDTLGIYNPSKRAFVALFGYGKRHTTLETYDETIANAFRDYILPKILFTPLGTLYKYKPKPLKLPPLEKALEDAKKDLDAETDPVKQKVIRSLMKKIISSIPKAKEYDDAEIAKREMYNAKDELTKQRNIEMLAEQKRIKKEIKDKEDEEKRLRLEAINKEREEQKAKAAEIKARKDKMEQEKQKEKQYKNLIDAKNKWFRIRDDFRYKQDLDNWIKAKELLDTLPFEDVDWYYELKEILETFLSTNKDIALKNGLKLFKTYKSQIEKPSKWAIDRNETEQEFVERATKKRYDLAVNLKKYFTKEELTEGNKNPVKSSTAEDVRDRLGGTGIDNPELYEKAKIIADNLYDKPSAYKSGFIVKTYKELGGTYSGKKPNKSGIARWFKEEWKDIGDAEYPVYRPTKRITKDTPLTPEEIQPSNLRSQIALKQKIKGTENLPPFLPFGKVERKNAELNGAGVHIEQYSNPKIVFKKAKEYLGKDVEIEISNKKDKKYMVKTPDGRWVHFGQLGYEDFTKHKDEQRRKNYLTRTANMKGDWKYDKYSPNNLSRNILW